MRQFTETSAMQALPRGSKAWFGRYGSVRGLWVLAKGATIANGMLLHLHGGGFVFGSARSHRGLAHLLSRRTKRAVFLPDYRRAPEHPYPAAADDCLAAYREMLKRGVAPERIVVSGDSAGGHLTACLLADLARDGLPMPSHAVLFSPWLDLSGELTVARDKIRRDPFVAPNAIMTCRRAYLGEGDPATERLDVLNADKTGWPPVLIQVGDTECLLEDSRQLAASLRAAKVRHELQEWPGQMHVFQVFANLLPEARQAVRYVADFVSP
jgi:acetyl esterase/lipase